MTGIYLLGRNEKVVVSDFYAGIIDLKSWIPPDHHLYGMSVDQLYRYFAGRLRPKDEILRKIDQFYQTHLASSDFISVHARGSDKVVEMGGVLDKVNKEYREVIDRYLSGDKSRRIFLMTDDTRLLANLCTIYGDKVIATDCQRTSSAQGVHYQTVPDRHQLGIEVMVDVYLATKGEAFVGNGFSNPSVAVWYLKNWSANDVHLIGPNMCYMRYG
jgi:hypothetical protein